MKSFARGFTLVEVLITVAITAVLVAIIVIPAMRVVKTSKLRSCTDNINAIEAAKTSWCSDHLAEYQQIRDGTHVPEISVAEIAAYFPMKEVPTCPERSPSDLGNYVNVNKIGSAVECLDSNGHSRHTE